MQRQHVLEDGRLGDELAEESVEGLLHALQGEHLGDQQIERIRLDADPVLQGTAARVRERPSGHGGAMRAGLDLGIDVRDELLEDDVDLGAPFVALDWGLVQILAACLAEADFGDFAALDGAGMGGTRVSLSTLPLPWVPARVSAVPSCGVCEAGLLELVLFCGVFLSMNTAISTFRSISRASIKALLSAVILPSARSCAKRPWRAANSSRRDSLLTLATGRADYASASTAISAASTASRSPGGKAR